MEAGRGAEGQVALIAIQAELCCLVQGIATLVNSNLHHKQRVLTRRLHKEINVARVMNNHHHCHYNRANHFRVGCPTGVL
jgi:hypothetical protein